MEQAKKRDHKIFIADVAIHKVPCVKIPELSEVDCKRLQQEHKNLLQFAKYENNSDEVALIYNSTGSETIYIKGDADSVYYGSDADYVRLYADSYPGELFVLHNHPNTSKFSVDDIIEFISEGPIGLMSVVTNQGQVYILKKTAKYNYERTKKIFYNLYSDFRKGNIDKETAVNEFLKLCREGGVCYEG